MYGVAPPRSSDSGGVAAGDAEYVRTYHTWKGSNIFLLQGRFIFGPDARSIFLTMFLIIAPVAVFCVFVAQKLMDAFPGHWGLSILLIVVVFTVYDVVLLLLTSGRDPGIVPRNKHPPEPEGYEGSMDSGQSTQLRLPRVKDIVVNGITVKVKYCDTCMLYRPPRCSHCSICNNCVEKFDHHCPWVGQCIGLRNYRFFFMFVFSSTLLCLYVHGFCWVYIRKIMASEHTTIWKAMSKTPASIVLIVYTFVSVWFVGGLSVFHLYLIGTNQSTYENFRYRYDQRSNPYNRGVVENFMEVFCTRVPPSKNKFRAKVLRDPEVPAQAFSDDFSVSKLRKPMGDIEMGRKPVWDGDASAISDFEREYSNSDSQEKDAELPIVSPELSRITLTDGAEGRSILHSRRSSWAKNRSLDMAPEPGSSSSQVPKEPAIFQQWHHNLDSIASPEIVSMASRFGELDQSSLGDRFKEENQKR
ncbi:OLC1v1013687C1 [Oldenlandia corymbosa var. corymbosa]|uniref:S-acyltransferase n=1 Tax=Oldenlandia corymbosa var. corymbosa TaxID=529605 RepID=A0AAV1DZ94_OLDCO|nr:OLC1v1013687C1 [Oldenlandia corymbosa var. corymbosa]